MYFAIARRRSLLFNTQHVAAPGSDAGAEHGAPTRGAEHREAYTN
ncbi:MAG: hypothetical protein NTY19_45345 [Planctomycetota bacterium]|nr:hypothetical protein [Planctomycetota bacterium]